MYTKILNSLKVAIVLLAISVFIVNARVTPVRAIGCYINGTLGYAQYGGSGAAHIQIGTDGHDSNDQIQISNDGGATWRVIGDLDKCRSNNYTNGNPLDASYAGDICLPKIAQGNYQYMVGGITPSTQYTIRLKNDGCGATSDYQISGSNLPYTGAPLPPGVTQNVYKVCMEPTRLDDYNHIVSLRSKYPLTKNIPVGIIRRTSLTFLEKPSEHADFCAVDKNNSPVCEVLPNSWIDPGSFKILDLTGQEVQDALTNAPDSILVIPRVKSYTHGSESGQTLIDEHAFFAYQTINTSPPVPTPTSTNNNSNQTDESSLRLASFTPTPTYIPTPTPTAAPSDCLTIFWDPRGMVADTSFLEPIEQASVTLKSKNALGNITEFLLPENALFRNPFTTANSGAFNFAVPAGTYFLNVTKSGFTYPVSTTLLSSSANVLRAFDPSGEYIDTSKLYNNSSEPIIEKEGQVEVRHMLMEPPAEYAGTAPSILSYNQLLDVHSQQIIYGIVSHPKAIVAAFVNNGLITQTQAAPNGQFKLILEGASILKDAKNIQLRVEKVAIGKLPVPASTQFSKMYTIELLPSHVAGFAFSSDYSVAPGALVEVIVPELNDLVYVSTHADANGFARIQNINMPPFPYLIRVRNPKTFATLSIQKPKEFIALNKTYYTNEQTNPYNEKDTIATPSIQTLNQIQRESKKNKELVQQGKLDPLTRASEQSSEPTQVPDQTKSSSQNAGRLAALLIIVLLLPIGVGFVIMKSRNRTTEL